MDLAVTLVKSVMRAFYATREILVIDALILHEAYVLQFYSQECTARVKTYQTPGRRLSLSYVHQH